MIVTPYKRPCYCGRYRYFVFVCDGCRECRRMPEPKPRRRSK